MRPFGVISKKPKTDSSALSGSTEITMDEAESSKKLPNEYSISAINFQIGGVDRGEQKVRGKRKKGGLLLEPGTIICEIVTSDRCSFRVYASCGGSLLESNKRLIEQPNLILTKPATEGYICVIQPFVNFVKSVRLMGWEDYFKHVMQHRHQQHFCKSFPKVEESITNYSDFEDEKFDEKEENTSKLSSSSVTYPLPTALQQLNSSIDYRALADYSCPYHSDCPARVSAVSLFTFSTNRANKAWAESLTKKIEEFKTFYSPLNAGKTLGDILDVEKSETKTITEEIEGST
eukprot:MONOS_3520.2-p1 / transcript=MONOS_3520.2 / gene=MONOS_3520 / organism=Monocercomonoides_exilis_PA203 / gene_product=unspecified product / transcript_product=unspecified product / location=Mono_scaffold00083:94018-95087(-) / protein_length=289 / sequence_SO=supercontig / SO=protein_coding / is_pseudo=false